MKDELVSNELPSVRSWEAPVFLYSSTLPTSSQETPKPMQLGRTRLTPEERQRWHQANLCLYCGQASHCPAKDSATPQCHLNDPCSIPNSSSWTVLTLWLCSLTLGLMPASWMKSKLGIYLVPLSRPISASVLNSYVLGTVTHQTLPVHVLLSRYYHETILFHILKSPHIPLILRYSLVTTA